MFEKRNRHYWIILFISVFIFLIGLTINPRVGVLSVLLIVVAINRVDNKKLKNIGIIIAILITVICVYLSILNLKFNFGIFKSELFKPKHSVPIKSN